MTIKYPASNGPNRYRKLLSYLGIVKARAEDDSERDALTTATGDEANEVTQAVDEEEEVQLNLWGSVVVLAVATVVIAFTAEILVGSIDGLAQQSGIPKKFIGLILLPIVGNAAEHVTAIVVAWKDKLTLSLSVAIGSSIASSFLPL